jgi:hypothetical protein
MAIKRWLPSLSHGHEQRVLFGKRMRLQTVSQQSVCCPRRRLQLENASMLLFNASSC